MDVALNYRAQVPALPVKGRPGAYQVLLVTSRETHRWVIPKGWPMRGREDYEAAAQEALEEAGVSGRIHKHPMGAFAYDKRLPDGSSEPIRVMVYLLEVEKQSNKWREKDQRKREWMSTARTAICVDEAGLAEIIKRLDVSAMDAIRD